MAGSPGNPDPSPQTRFGAANANPSGNGRGLPKGVALCRTKPPKMVRDASRHGYYKRIPLLRQIADGELTIKQTVVTQKGDVFKIDVAPTFSERIRAIEVLAKYGGIQSLKVEVEPPGAEEAVRPNFRNLTVEQLAQLEALVAQLHPSPPLLTTAAGVEVYEHDEEEHEEP